MLVQTWNGLSWVHSGQRLTTFDSQNRIVHELIQTWNNPDWENTEQDYFWWNANNLDSGLIQEFVDTAWVNTNFLVNNFNANNLLTVATYYEWFGGGWLLDVQELFSYNLNDDVVELLNQLWHGQWDNSYREQYFYNSGFLKEQTDFYSWGGTSWGNPSSEFYSYDANDMILTLINQSAFFRDSTQYYYTDVTGISENDLLENNIYVLPNPARETINIKSTSPLNDKFHLSLVDLAGRILLKDNLSLNSADNFYSIDASILKSGIYFLELTNNNHSLVKKIINE